MQKHFRDMPTRKEMTTDAPTLLRNVLTDAYFRAMTDGEELDAPPASARPTPAVAPAPAGPAGPGAPAAAQPEDDPLAEQAERAERMSVKAQATAWALFYYLYRERPDEFRKYAAELDRLPRDLPVDERTAVEVFARAFTLSTGPTPEPGKTSFKEFADAWVERVMGTTPAGVDVTLKPPPPPGSTPMPGTPPGRPMPRPPG
jgi:hypothetical protein